MQEVYLHKCHSEHLPVIPNSNADGCFIQFFNDRQSQ